MALLLLCLSIYHLQKYYVPSFVELSTLPYAVKEKNNFQSSLWILQPVMYLVTGRINYFGRIVPWTISKAV